MGHIARQETEVSNSIAMETKRDNAQMKSVASLTMVYLPLTSVAVRVLQGIYIYALTKSSQSFRWECSTGTPRKGRVLSLFTFGYTLELPVA
jgi:hypothetical protein